jgi:hypothetical protein
MRISQNRDEIFDMIINRDDIKMNFEKIKAIVE